tara:strand:- start:356 stop:1054 length:699 start_codon:yes stop_codon:yes gene_type:complete
MNSPKVSLCLIVRNEITGCKGDVPLLPKEHLNEIFAVDGGSTDGTVEYLESQGIKVYKQKKRGINNAYIEANEKSKNDNIIVFFPKKTIDPNIIFKFKKFFSEDYDLIISSRMHIQSVNEEDNQFLKFRKWSSLFLSKLVSIIWKKNGTQIKDILHGVKGWKRNAFNKMKILDHGITIDLEMVLQSYKLNLKSVEFPIQEKPLTYRESYFPFWSTGFKLMKFLIFEIFNLNK